jgi:hypothetical protein
MFNERPAALTAQEQARMCISCGAQHGCPEPCDIDFHVIAQPCIEQWCTRSVIPTGRPACPCNILKAWTDNSPWPCFTAECYRNRNQMDKACRVGDHESCCDILAAYYRSRESSPGSCPGEGLSTGQVNTLLWLAAVILLPLALIAIKLAN